MSDSSAPSCDIDMPRYTDDSVDDQLTSGSLSIDSLMIPHGRCDAFSAVMQRSGAPTRHIYGLRPLDAERSDQPSKVPGFAKPLYVTTNLQDWWYHPQIQNRVRIFKPGDMTAEIDVPATLSYMHRAHNPGDLGDLLMEESSFVAAQDPDNQYASQIANNIKILQEMYDRHERGVPIMPYSRYKLKE